MPIQSFHELRDILAQDARDALFAIRQVRPKEKLYTFAISTDDDAVTPRAIGNTEEALATKVAQDRDIDSNERAMMEYGYRWTPDEWLDVYFEGGPRPPARSPRIEDFLEEMMAFMHSWTSIPGNTFKKFRANVFRAMVDALITLDREGLFGQGKDREDVTLFISVTDPGIDTFMIEYASAKLLNPRRAANRMREGLPILQRWQLTLLNSALWLKRGRIIARSLPK